jgi:hypothetical protein
MYRFVRDENSQGIVNADHDGLAAYRAKRQRRKDLEEMQSDINSIKQQIERILTLLQPTIKNET